ncbi:MAG TPA: hypothetical protein VII72_19020 [Myxococcota bacterium]|jgi:hypothetical protein
MEIFAGLSVGFLILTAGVVATKTFALWRRTRGLPELLLSLYLSCATVLGYPLMIASTQIPASEMWPLHLAGQVVTSFGFVCLLSFTLKVFRPEALWARGLVGLCLLLFAAGGVAYFVELTGDNPRPAGELIGITLINSTPIALAYFWAMLESMSYYRRLRLRLRLGLAEVAVVNRVLLWGLMSFAAGIAVIISLAGMLAGSFLTAPFVLVLSCLGAVHACCLFLAFHPPGWYRLWLERRAPVEAS